MLKNFYNNLKSYGIFAIVGFFSGLICFFWDIDDYGLIMAAMPGWLFGLVFITTLFIKVKLFSLSNLFKALVWIFICAVCFVVAVEMVSSGELGLIEFNLGDDFGMLTPGIAGFITTLIMVLGFRMLFKVLRIVDMISISVIAGIISYCWLPLFLFLEEFKGIVLLFVLYHSIVSWCLGVAVMRQLNVSDPQFKVISKLED